MACAAPAALPLARWAQYASQMSRFRFALPSLFVLVFAMSCGSGAAEPHQPPTPYDGVTASVTLSIQGLTGPVDIVRDRYGVPHVYATTLADAAFGFGYV